jgi:hypothetical protein
MFVVGAKNSLYRKYFNADDYMLIKAPFMRDRQLTMEAKKRNAVLCDSKVFASFQGINIKQAEVVNNNGKKQVQKLHPLEKENAFRSTAMVKESVFRLFDEESREAMRNMSAADRYEVLDAAYHWANQVAEYKSKDGFIKRVCRGMAAVLGRFSDDYEDRLVDKLRNGSHYSGWINLEEWIFSIPYAVTFREGPGELVPYRSTIPERSELLNLIGLCGSLIGGVTGVPDFMVLVRGSGECIYDALEKAGFVFNRSNLINSLEPLNRDGLFKLFERVSEASGVRMALHEGKFVTVFGETGTAMQFKLTSENKSYHIEYAGGTKSNVNIEKILKTSMLEIQGLTNYQLATARVA